MQLLARLRTLAPMLLLGALAASASAQEQTLLYFNSQAGDYIGGGQQVTITDTLEWPIFWSRIENRIEVLFFVQIIGGIDLVQALIVGDDLFRRAFG